MIVPFARAVQGFIQVSDAPNLASTDNFLQCLQKIMTFENVDIQDFDGNTCRIISSEDPTNSIFIYTNDTSTYLYQVVKASPVLHKNKKIWLCDTYEMEDVAKINDILKSEWQNHKVMVDMYKNIAINSRKKVYEEDPNDAPVEKIETKGNFNAKTICGADVNIFLCYKIKCLTDPTGLGLTSIARDGSFNFFFPMRIGYDVGGAEIFYHKIENGSTHAVLSIEDIVSKYLPNIKSIEIVPVWPENSNQSTGYVTIDLINTPQDAGATLLTLGGTAVWTDCGVFIPQGHTNVGNGRTYSMFDKYLNNRQLIQGGGARGFLRTPLGNVELDFADCRQKVAGNYGAVVECILLDEGWKIDGMFKCIVPPHYINFYTDNAGQVFIQNLTTNAQELRALERQNVAKQEEQQQSYVYGQVTNALETAATAAQKFASLDLLGGAGAVAQGAINAGMLAVENEFNKAKIDREYGRSLTEYRDKISTQSLLASLTGKQISGNVTLSDFLRDLKNNYFRIFVEFNYVYRDGYYYQQVDYDYSSSSLPNMASQESWEAQSKYRNIVCFNADETKIYTLMSAIFGYAGLSAGIDWGFIWDYDMWKDNVGLNYSIVFSLETNNNKFSKTLNFPIRRNKKHIT